MDSKKDSRHYSDHTFLKNGGEMSRLIMEYDWSSTALGSIDTWPQSLKTIVSAMLNSRFPMFLWWGEELIQFYNDDYRPSLGNNGKHPKALGQKGLECWPEIWADIKPLIDTVITEGKASWSEDELLPIYRNGNMEDVYWTFSYSPVYDESDTVNGVLVVCSETTDKVLALESIKKSEYFNRQLVNNSVAAQCVFIGEDMIVSLANEYMLQIWGADASAIGKPFMDILPDLRSTPVPERMLRVLHTGEPFYQPEERFELTLYGKPYTGYYTYSYQALQDASGKNYGIVSTALEITQYVLNRKKVEEADEKSRLAIESAELGTYEIDLKTDAMKTSERFKKIWGLADTKREVSRTEFAALIHQDDLEKRKAAHAESEKTGYIFYEARVIWPDQSLHWVMVSGKIIYDAEQQPQYLLGIIKDITKEKEHERYKDDFISVVSHELKTPITSLKAYTDILAEKYQTSDDYESVMMIGRTQALVKRIHLIIEDLMDVIRLDGNKMHLRQEYFDINALINQVMEETSLSEKMHTITFEPAAAIMVYADREKIMQVITNLLSNAIKYSPAKSQVIISSAIKDNTVICSLQDFGKGISGENQKKIFERFYQISGKNRDNIGLGLGLYICAEILKKQSGNIWLESEPGKGSTFHFSLPYSPGQSI